MIRAAFVDLISEKKLISNISVSELAEKADIAKSTFYNHYEDIYAVADELFKEIISGLEAVIDNIERFKTVDYQVYIQSIFSYLREGEDFYRKLVASPEAIYFIDRVKHIVTKRTFDNVKSPSFFKNATERYVQINFFANACIDTMVDYLKGEFDMTFDQFEKTITAILKKTM